MLCSACSEDPTHVESIGLAINLKDLKNRAIGLVDTSVIPSAFCWRGTEHPECTLCECFDALYETQIVAPGTPHFYGVHTSGTSGLTSEVSLYKGTSASYLDPPVHREIKPKPALDE